MIESKEDSNGITLTPSEGLVNTEADALKAKLDESIDKNPTITIDMKSVKTLSSSAIGTLISAHKKLHQKSGSLKLINLTEDNLEMLKIMKLDQYMIN